MKKIDSGIFRDRDKDKRGKKKGIKIEEMGGTRGIMIINIIMRMIITTMIIIKMLIREKSIIKAITEAVGKTMMIMITIIGLTKINIANIKRTIIIAAEKITRKENLHQNQRKFSWRRKQKVMLFKGSKWKINKRMFQRRKFH